MTDSAETLENDPSATTERSSGDAPPPAPSPSPAPPSQGRVDRPGFNRSSGGDQPRRLPATPGNLYTEQGQTTIADVVVTKVAGIAAREVGGVHALGGGMTRAFGAVTQRLPGTDPMTQGVSVEVGETEAAVDLTVVIDYGESIPRVAAAVRENIIRRIEGICGLSVKEVNIAVTDLYFPGEDESQPARRELQ
jgi:uncharacterized alkaline shock family protein YloU